MDLLELQLDLNVEGNSSSGPITRRSQAIRTAAGTPSGTPKTSKATPKTVSTATTKTPAPAKNPTPKLPGTSKAAKIKPSEASSSTPKTPTVSALKVASATSTASKVSTPKQVETKKSTTIVASAPKTEAVSTPKAPVVAKINTSKPTTSVSKDAAATPAPSQSQTPKVPATIPKLTKLGNDFSESPTPTESRGSSLDRTSRADSIERRSRNKAMKRFSPSPVVSNKKRKSIPTPHKDAVSGTMPISDSIFAEHLVVLEELFKSQGPTDFKLPAHWIDPSSPDSSEHVTDLDTNSIIDSTLNTETPTQTAVIV